MSDTNFGKRLKTARENQGLTQQAVIEKTQIAKVQTLSSYERGVNSPPLETLKELAELYCVTTDYLLFGAESDTRRAKTDRDYFIQLVEATDHLRLPLTESSKSDLLPWKVNCSININPPVLLQNDTSNWEESDFIRFICSWKQLRKAEACGAISWSDYKYLMEKWISTIPNDLDLTTDCTLPF